MGRFISMGRPAPATPATPAVKPFPHAMGYYNEDGSWHQQKVHLGRTQSGTCGLFTSNLLVWPIEPMLFDCLKQDPTGLKLYVERRGFVLDQQ